MSLSFPGSRVGYFWPSLLMLAFFLTPPAFSAPRAAKSITVAECSALLEAAGMSATLAKISPDLREWFAMQRQRETNSRARVRLTFFHEAASPKAWSLNVPRLEQTAPTRPDATWMTARQFQAAVTLLKSALPPESNVKIFAESHRVDRGTVILEGLSDEVARLLATLSVPGLKLADTVDFQNIYSRPLPLFAWPEPVGHGQAGTAAIRRAIESMSETEIRTVAVEVDNELKAGFVAGTRDLSQREDSGTDPWTAPTRLFHVAATKAQLLDMMTWPEVVWLGDTPHGLIPTWKMDPQYLPSTVKSKAEGTFLIANSVASEVIARWVSDIRANASAKITVVTAKEISPRGATFVRLQGPSKSIFWANDLMDRAGMFLMSRHIQFPESKKIDAPIDIVGRSPDSLYRCRFMDPRDSTKTESYRATLAAKYGAMYDEIDAVMTAILTREQILEIAAMPETQKVLEAK